MGDNMDERRQKGPILFLCHSDSEIVNEISKMEWGIHHIKYLTHSHSDPSVMKEVQVGVVELSEVTNMDMVELFVRTYASVFWVAIVSKPYLSSDAVRYLLKNYFYDFHTSPPDFTRLQYMLGHALGMAKLCASPKHTDTVFGINHGILGQSQCMEHLNQQLKKLSRCQLPVLITGESGTGKELVAQELHKGSECAQGPFIPVNCGALPAQLVQSELFGHEKGAFTGATQRKIGRVEAAHNGSLFLDEIGDLPLEEQVNLLRFLQEKTIERVGSHQSIHLNVRIIAATHVDLEKAVQEGRFREDLYFRLNVIRLKVPPLRQRGDDVLLLARRFLQQQQEGEGGRLDFSEQAEVAMLQYRWPGNVRELLNRVQRASVMASGRYIQPVDLEIEAGPPSTDGECLKTIREEAEREALSRALTESHGKVSSVAKQLNVSRATLYRLLDKHSLL
ncbi:sigma-54 dependent transcriptional regulator [Oceanisphaera pacifica]|uniref:Sigma-54-dependent Fis family transcriptional regulator n=1 Tax=Oceanisphaera pacifica TaxID=2818389 RepID=A0ABS3NF63_9GAMM|nr:sigma-54 dependent transcriptional regulator [Oceanisphaera pacifica]MBO1519223.1 sigma-54-dependent Fis family transcriptional regulator [Oceanisphaera pacifica]